MKVIINGQASAGARTGVGHYAAELSRCLRASCAPDEVVCVQPDPLAGLKRRLSPVRAWMDAAPAKDAGPSAADRSFRLTWGQWLLWKAKQAALVLTAARFRGLARGFDLYHEPNFIPLRCDLPTVVSVHDLSVILHPEWHPAHRVFDWEERFRGGLGRARHVLTISDHVRHEIITHLGLPPEMVTRTYCGPRPHFRRLPPEETAAALRRLGLPPSYLLHVGTIEPRKNLLLLLRAYRDLPAEVRAACPLVLVGGWGWNSADVHDFLAGPGKQCGVIHAGYVAEADLPAVYNGARALVFPTRYEGFGMPTVEMFACGGAVIASTAGAVAEVVAGRGVVIDPDDLECWRDAMRRVITDDDWRVSLTRGGVELAATFTWERCAAETLAAYRRAAAAPARRAA